MSVVPKNDGVFGTTPRRVRHISSIQVRNLTPFPVRDAFATALSQPSEKPQFTEFGHLSDDLDVTLSRKRSRRISSNSIATHISRRSDDSALDDQSTDAKNKKASRLSFSASGTIKPSSLLGAPATPLSGSAPTLRSPGHRMRTTSMASSLNAPFNVTTASFAPSTTAGPSTSAVPMSLSAMLPDHSQAELEKVIKSRLVETFVAITVPTPAKVPHEAVRNEHEKAPRSLPSTPVPVVHSRRDTATSTHHKSASSISTKVSKLTQSDTRKPAMARTEPPKSPPSPMRNGPGHSRTPTATSVRINGKAGAPPCPTPKRPSPPAATPKRSPSPAKRPSSPFTPPPALPVPNYLSHVHRPSTNPSFAIDARPGCEFAEWTDLSAEKIQVEIWGRVGNEWRSRRDPDATVKAKGKEKEEPASDPNDGWKVLQEWSFDMADLVPLPDNIASSSAHLPSNTLVVTLSPSGKSFYLPQKRRPSSRAPSPSLGYSSDPESGYSKTRRLDEGASEGVELSVTRQTPVEHPNRMRKRRGRPVEPGGPGDDLKTAGWQDLLKLVTLQACIIDNRNSLEAVVLEIDSILEKDTTAQLKKREVSELDCRVEGLRGEHRAVRERSSELRELLESRRADIEARRQMLLLARDQHEEDQLQEINRKLEVDEARERLTTLRRRFAPTRSILLSTVSTIHPIELLSPPHLLFTILSVPLPIPLSPTDPAPPLSLHNRQDVNEDAVATALGYAAQVVQLLAAYLGKGLVYPVTCVGSRSLIKDGISAMVGPRMFPLFSKGVDTYRFEYGVFLLNKDIEMLMADRDLRALDMRHTLPNLKNLLLTLTDGDNAQTRTIASLNSPQMSVSSLASSPRADSPPALEVTPSSGQGTPTPTTVDLPDNKTPPTSGSSTPTSQDSSSRLSFLGLSPLAGFLRSRYHSSHSTSAQSTMKPVSEALEWPLPESSASTGSDADDEEDRTTLKDVLRSVAPPEIEDSASELKADVITKSGNGNIIGGFENEREASPQEKQPNVVHLALPPAITPPPALVNAAG